MNSKNDNTKNIPIKSRKYKTLKNEIGSLNYSISFQRDYLLGMLNNLSYMNNIKLFQDTDSLFMSMLNELKIIKEELEKYPNIISFKNVDSDLVSQYSQKNKEINDLLIKYSN